MITNRTDYDSVEGVRRWVLKDLDSLHLFFKYRRDGYKQTEQPWAHRFIIFGRYLADETGNLGILDERQVDQVEKMYLHSVVSMYDLGKVLDEPFFSFEIRDPAYALPTSSTKCPGCGGGWSLKTAHENQQLNEEMWHTRCARLRIDANARTRFTEVVEKAGFELYSLNGVKNEYCPCKHCPPWFILGTPHGDIKIGWRKRVINIDWSSTGIELEELTKDDVTKELTLVHAWGYDKAIEYLTELRKRLKEEHP